MELQEKIDISILNSFYGSLLTSHQQEMLRLYYDCDISLFEISEQFGVSRQAVRDAIVRGEKALISYEDNLHLYKKNQENIKLINSVIENINNGNNEKVIDTLNAMLLQLED